jgi:hypothetical protein
MPPSGVPGVRYRRFEWIHLQAVFHPRGEANAVPCQLPTHTPDGVGVCFSYSAQVAVHRAWKRLQPDELWNHDRSKLGAVIRLP